jgi:hypothetical protein
MKTHTSERQSVETFEICNERSRALAERKFSYFRAETEQCNTK